MKKMLGNLTLASLAVVIGLLLCEGVLAMLQFEPYYKSYGNSITPEIQAERSRFCDIETIEEAVSTGLMKGPAGRIKLDPELGYTHWNEPHGFNDKKNFFDDYSKLKRILMLGDSFTMGAAAAEGSGFVDLLNKHFEERGMTFFNTGVGGYSQNNQLAVLTKYFHVIKPHLVILGFYTGNDFLENLHPLDRQVVFKHYAILKNEVTLLGSDMKIRRRTSQEIMRFYKRAIGCPGIGPQAYSTAKAYLREEVFYRTRLGTKVWELLHLLKQGVFKALSNKIEGSGAGELAHDYIVTKKYLSDIKNFLAAREAPFYVFLIPDQHESTKKLEKSRDYRRAEKLLEQLAIPYLDIFRDLSIDDYVSGNARVPLLLQNTHWNQAGHNKAFQKIRDCFGNVSESDAIQFCLN